MALCRFCNRTYKNKQAVRKHLGSCQPYKTHKAQQEQLQSENLPKADHQNDPTYIGSSTLGDSTSVFQNITHQSATTHKLSEEVQETQLRNRLRKLSGHSRADLLDLSDQLMEFLEWAVHLVRWNQLAGGYGNYEGKPSWKEWYALGKEIEGAFSWTKEMLKTMNPNIEVLSQMYHSIKGVRGKWEQMRRSDSDSDFAGAPEGKKRFEESIDYELFKFDQAIELLRRLLD